MQSLLFLFTREFKKSICNKGMFVFLAAFILNLINICAEYIDRSKSIMYSTGVHVEGKGLEYFINNQIGNFGIIVLYLFPLLLTTSPLFADEYRTNMVFNIFVTKYGRIKGTAIKILCNNIISFLWIVLCYGSSLLLSLLFFDTGITGKGETISCLVRCGVNVILGSFFMLEIFAFVSSMVKSNISAVVINFAILVFPMYINNTNKKTNLLPVIGMQAKNYLESGAFSKAVWRVYVLGGVIFVTLSLIKNRKVAG